VRVGRIALVAAVVASLAPAGARAAGSNPHDEASPAASARAPQAILSVEAPEPSPPPVVEPVALRVQGPQGARSGETWDFAFVFDSGERLLLRFALTNIGPGDRNAAAVWHWIDPAGGVVEYDNGQREAGWSLEKDARLIRIQSSVLDLRRPTLRLAMTKKRAQIHLAVELPPEPLHTATQGGDRHVLWATHAPVEGSYQKRGMTEARPLRGNASLFYSWVGDEESELRRVDFVSFDVNTPFYTTAILRENGRHESWALFLGADGSRRLTREVVLCPGSRDEFAWPGRLLIRDPELRAVIRVDPPFLRYDPLSALPRTLGALVSWLYKPMRLWSNASLETEGRGSPTRGVLRTTFGNPLKRGVREKLGTDPACRGGAAG
jgi:hypothetical protein